MDPSRWLTPEPAQTEDESPKSSDEVDLVLRVLSGDRAAYGVLMSRYQRRVYHLAYSILGSWQDAQDVSQEAFFAAYRRLPKLKDPGKFGGWLFGTARHICYVTLRKRRVIGEQVPIEEVEFLATRPVEDIPGDREALMLQGIRDLPEKYQVLLRLKYLGGYSYQRVAEMLDLPEVTVKSRLFEGRRMLRERVAYLVRTRDDF